MDGENNDDESKDIRGDVMKEASTGFGFRALSKARWDELEKEYKD